jgi:hypothetical protein
MLPSVRKPKRLAALNDHLTPVLVVPATVAVNCWVCDAVSETEAGATETLAA